MIFDHFILSLLLSECSLYVLDPHFYCLIIKAICFRVLVIFEPLNVEIDAVLWLDVFDVPSAQINAWLFINNLSLFKGYSALILFDVDIG